MEPIINVDHKFKDKQGRWLGRSLIAELTHIKDKYEPVFTVSDPPKPGFIPFKEAFLSTNDPTGYTFANEYMGGWDHYQTLYTEKRGNWFKQLVDECLLELEIKIRAAAMQTVVKSALDPYNKNAPSSAKWLVEKGWKRMNEGSVKENKAASDAIDDYVMAHLNKLS